MIAVFRYFNKTITVTVSSGRAKLLAITPLIYKGTLTKWLFPVKIKVPNEKEGFYVRKKYLPRLWAAL